MVLTQGIPIVTLENSIEEEAFPRVPTDLLEALESKWPDVCPHWSIGQAEYAAYCGRLEVIKFLRRAHDNPIINLTKDTN